MSNNFFPLLISSLLFLHAASVMSQTENEEPLAVQPDVRVYVGIDYFEGETDYKITAKGDLVGTERFDLDQKGFKFKWGAILENSWRIQGYFKNEELESFDNDVHGVGIDVIKAFPIGTSHFSPFIQTGAGYDWTDLDEEENLSISKNSIKAYNFKLGVGVLYEIVDTFEIMAGFDWQYRSWDTVNIYSVKIETEDTATTPYVGLSMLF